MTPTKDDLSTIMDFVAQDDADFDVSTFIDNWPSDDQVQRIAVGMLVARASREVQRLARGYARLWVVSIAAMAVGSLSLFLAINLRPAEAVGGALVSVAGSLLLRALTR